MMNSTCLICSISALLALGQVVPQDPGMRDPRPTAAQPTATKVAFPELKTWRQVRHTVAMEVSLTDTTALGLSGFMIAVRSLTPSEQQSLTGFVEAVWPPSRIDALVDGSPVPLTFGNSGGKLIGYLDTTGLSGKNLSIEVFGTATLPILGNPPGNQQLMGAAFPIP